jgi:hypothetical protein
MRERTYNLPILESGGAHAPYCTNDCQYCHTNRRKLKLEIAYHPQREISRMQVNPVCVATKNDYYLLLLIYDHVVLILLIYGHADLLLLIYGSVRGGIERRRVLRDAGGEDHG